MDLPDSDNSGGEVETVGGVGGGRGPKSFIQTIFDMIRSILGSKFTSFVPYWLKLIISLVDGKSIIREDGTVEDVNDGDGFLTRIGKRIMRMISSLMEMVTGGGNGGFRLDLSNLPRFSKVAGDEIERQLARLDNPSSK